MYGFKIPVECTHIAVAAGKGGVLDRFTLRSGKQVCGVADSAKIQIVIEFHTCMLNKKF